MNDSRMHDEHGPPPVGARTAGDGTPVPVQLAAEPTGRRALLIFVAGPLIWTIHFMIVYLVVEAGCTGDGPGFNLFDPPVPTLVTLAATGLAAAACLASARWAYGLWRRRTITSDAAAAEERSEGEGALAFGGFLLSLLGAIVVLFVGVPALVLPACG